MNLIMFCLVLQQMLYPFQNPWNINYGLWVIMTYKIGFAVITNEALFAFSGIVMVQLTSQRRGRRSLGDFFFFFTF